MDTTTTTARGSEGAPMPVPPAHRVAEIVDGTPYVNPRPDPLRTLAGSRLGAGLSHAYWFGRGGPQQWWIMFEAQLRLGADILVPDWVGWRRERMPELPDTSFFTLAPDWVCEVLSPAKGSGICGSSTRRPARWRRSSCAKGSGCWLRAQRTRRWSASGRSMRSP